MGKGWAAVLHNLCMALLSVYYVMIFEQAVILEETPTPEDWQTVAGLVKRQHYDALLLHDQLNKAVASGAVLSGFTEAPITFPPTFKVSTCDSAFVSCD